MDYGIKKHRTPKTIFAMRVRRLFAVSRQRKVGISLGILLAVSCGCSLWVLGHVWAWEQVTVQEPRFSVLVTETIGMGLAGIFGLLGAIYFWRKKKE